MTLSTISYPDNFPCVSRDSYGMVSSAGLIRDEPNNPLPLQRRIYTHLPTILDVIFTMPAHFLFHWQSWVNRNGYSWFNIKIAHPFMKTYDLAPLTPVRFIGSALSVSHSTFDYVTVSAQIELSPVVYAESRVLNPLDDWIVAKTPSNPSIDWFVSPLD